MGLSRLLPLGLVVGVVSGLFGIGGGVLVVVALVALRYNQHDAHATSLAAIILTSAAGVIPFALQDAVAVPAALALACGGIVGAYFGAGLMRRVPAPALRWSFLLFLVAVAVRMAIGVDAPGGEEFPTLSALALAACVGTGLATGAISAVLGVGGGTVMVPALVVAFAFSQHAAEGTSLAVVVPTAIVGALRHSRSGYTDWRSGLAIGVGGIAGGYLGATIALGLDALLLQRLFAVFLIVMAARLSLQKRPPAEPQVEP